MLSNCSVNYLTELLLLCREHDFEVEQLGGVTSVHKTEILRDRSIEYKSAECGIDKTRVGDAVYLAGNAHLDRRVHAEQAVCISHHGFVKISEYASLSGLAGAVYGEVIRTEHHILRRNSYGFTVNRLQEVVCGKHEEACLCLSFA